MRNLSITLWLISVIFCTACSANKEAAIATIREKTPGCAQVRRAATSIIECDYYVSSDTTGKIYLWGVTSNGTVTAPW